MKPGRDGAKGHPMAGEFEAANLRRGPHRRQPGRWPQEGRAPRRRGSRTEFDHVKGLNPFLGQGHGLRRLSEPLDRHEPAYCLTPSLRKRPHSCQALRASRLGTSSPSLPATTLWPNRATASPSWRRPRILRRDLLAIHVALLRESHGAVSLALVVPSSSSRISWRRSARVLWSPTMGLKPSRTWNACSHNWPLSDQLS